MSDSNQSILLEYCFKLIAARPRSEGEIREKIGLYASKRKIPELVQEQVLSQLKEKNFINDRDFTLWWVEQREAFRPKGRRLLQMELRAKGVPGDTIAEVLDTKEHGKDKQKELAGKLIQRKLPLWQNLSLLYKKKKISDFLARRGFSWEIISSVIDDCLKKD